MVFRNSTTRQVLPQPKRSNLKTVVFKGGFMALTIQRKNVESNFTKMPHYLTQGLWNLSSKAKNLYLFLYSQSPSYKPTMDGLAHSIAERGKRVSRSSIVRLVQELKNAGLLEIKGTAFKQYDWILYDPTWRKSHEAY